MMIKPLNDRTYCVRSPVVEIWTFGRRCRVAHGIIPQPANVSFFNDTISLPLAIWLKYEVGVSDSPVPRLMGQRSGKQSYSIAHPLVNISLPLPQHLSQGPSAGVVFVVVVVSYRSELFSELTFVSVRHSDHSPASPTRYDDNYVPLVNQSHRRAAKI